MAMSKSSRPIPSTLVLPLNKKAAAHNKEKTSQARRITALHSSAEADRERQFDEAADSVRDVTGTQTNELAERIIQQVVNAQIGQGKKDIHCQLLNAVAAIGEMQPGNATEALLATQMIATHEAGLSFLAAATRDDQTTEGRDANVLRATRLMRLHLEQIEAMQKLKGKASQQKVTVEHVHVHAGGQAIVGAIEAPGEGGGKGR